ncbi:MAG TPA: hypothetical protein VKX17_13750 [Planctomycetota bacterium]|nr:hypothetical protein [Planctomycetota bacterium]
MPTKRVVVIANKWWEADPLCAVLIHDKARPAAVSDFKYLNFPAVRAVQPKPGDPRPADPTPKPRMTFSCGGAAVEVWCLEELMNPAENSSSSLEKARVLPGAISYGAKPDLVIAFGTAGSREGVSANGCAVIGRRVFVHDPKPKQGLWTPPQPDQVVDSAFPSAAFGKISIEARHSAEARLVHPPMSPAQPPLVLLGDGFISVGVVNITNYADYAWADREAEEGFAKVRVSGQIGSIETTHGIIRAASKSPFLFVSGITDSEGLFDFQVTPRVYAQNFVCAHNAGVALAWLLPEIAAQL